MKEIIKRIEKQMDELSTLSAQVQEQFPNSTAYYKINQAWHSLDGARQLIELKSRLSKP